MKALVPAYFGPWETGAWERLVRSAPAVVIVNPASGPGTKTEREGYAEIVAALPASTRVIGYVPTGYRNRPKTAVDDDIRAWAETPWCDGVFSDEASLDSTEDCRLWWRGLHAHVRTWLTRDGRPGLHVLNPGLPIPSVWFQRMPGAVFVTYEGASPPPWPVSAHPAREAWLVHGAATGFSFPAGLGYGYATPDTLPNPWDTFP